MAGLGAVIGDAEAIDPVLPDRLAGRVVIGIVLEVVYCDEVGRHEIPERAFRRITDAVDRVHTPVVQCVPGEFAGIVTFRTQSAAAFIFW